MKMTETRLQNTRNGRGGTLLGDRGHEITTGGLELGERVLVQAQARQLGLLVAEEAAEPGEVLALARQRHVRVARQPGQHQLQEVAHRALPRRRARPRGVRLQQPVQEDVLVEGHPLLVQPELVVHRVRVQLACACMQCALQLQLAKLRHAAPDSVHATISSKPLRGARPSSRRSRRRSSRAHADAASLAPLPAAAPKIASRSPA